MSEAELLSDVGVDYTRLRELLADGHWKQADEETRSLMLEIAGRANEGWLNEDSMQKVPCTDLRTADKLWVEFSKGQFGFSVQKRIYYREVGQDWEKMGDRVGWRVKGEWLSIESLTYNLNAPTGHLPGCGAWVASLVWGLWARSADNFYKRVDSCKL